MFPLECEGEIRVRARTLNLLFFVVGTLSHSDRGLEILVSVEGRTLISSRRSECEFYCPKTCGNTNRISCARDQWRMGCVPREIRCVVHAATIKSFPDVFMTLAGIVTRDLSASSYSDRLLELKWEHVGFEIGVPRGQNWSRDQNRELISRQVGTRSYI